MSETPSYLNPYVRLTKDDTNKYYLEVMIPSNATIDTEDIDARALTPDEINVLEGENEDNIINYGVHIPITGTLSTTEYSYVTIELTPVLNANGTLLSNGILVSIEETLMSGFKGPKADGRSVIQFEDADR